MTLRVGSIGFATVQGIGLLLRDFHRHGVITDVVTIAHGRREEHPEWHPDAAMHVTSLRDENQRRRLFDWAASLDVFFAIETPFAFELFDHCRAAGVKTACLNMYECSLRQWPSRPNLFINPSLLDQQYYPEGVFIPVPVEAPWRRRERAELFVHVAGWGGLKGRNGTREVLQSLAHVKSPVDLLVRSQEPIPHFWDYVPKASASRVAVDYRVGTAPYEELYAEGDVFLFPERHNGLSLPLQEAHAAGMLVMCGARFPMAAWLPNEPLIKVSHYTRDRVSPRCVEFEQANFDPREIAATVDGWYGQDISEFSLRGKRWAEENSWQNLKPRYLEALSSI